MDTYKPSDIVYYVCKHCGAQLSGTAKEYTQTCRCPRCSWPIQRAFYIERPSAPSKKPGE